MQTTLLTSFSGYIWRTMKDARVRDSHIENHGKYFDWSIGATNLDKQGARHPGEDYNCRCYASPAFGPPAMISQTVEHNRGVDARTRDRNIVQQNEANARLNRTAATQSRNVTQNVTHDIRSRTATHAIHQQQPQDSILIDNYGASKSIHEFFGKSIRDEDIARLAGADVGDRVEISLQGNSIFVKITGKRIFARRFIFRENESLIMKNDTLHVVGQSGRGIGIAVFSQQVKYAETLGIKEIRTLAYRADGWNGYYTWARFGYDGLISDDILAILPANLRSARTIQELMALPGGKEFWLANGVSWEGIFNIRKNSLSRKVLKAYMEGKGMNEDTKRTDNMDSQPKVVYPVYTEEREKELTKEERRLDEANDQASRILGQLRDEYSKNPTEALRKKVAAAEKEIHNRYSEYAEFLMKYRLPRGHRLARDP